MTDSSPPQSPPEGVPAPNWKEAAIWMGAGLPALARMWWRHRFRLAPKYWFAGAFDAAFASGNSLLGLAEAAVRPSARNIEIGNPTFIVGHWRTGTTLLNELLATDPRRRCPTTFECFLPHHFRLSGRWLMPWTGFALPRTRRFDNVPLAWDRPQEDEFALANLGLPSPYTCIAFPNEPRRDWNYLDLEALSTSERERWKAGFQSFLKRLVAHRAGQLVLKSPPHTCRVPTLLELFPAARFVYVVRDPREVIPSTMRLWRTLFAAHAYQTYRDEGLATWVLETFAHFHDRFEATRSLIPAGQFALVRYEELTRAPAETVRRLYRELDLGETTPFEPVLEAFCHAQRDYRPNTHQRDASLANQIAQHCGPYAQLHGYA